MTAEGRGGSRMAQFLDWFTSPITGGEAVVATVLVLLGFAIGRMV